MFKPLRYDSGKLVTFQTASSTTINKGDALTFSSGYVTPASSSTAEVRAVAMEDKTTGASAHYDILCILTEGVEFEADCSGTPAQSQVGTKADLENAYQVNEDSSSADVFFITGIDAANRKVRGFFVMKTT